MLEVVTLSCTVMSQRKYTDSITPGESGERSKSRNRIHKSSHHDVREHKYSRNSSDDPSITSTRSDKHVSSNARSHPRAELKASDHSHSHRSKHVSSNHVHNHISPKSHDPDVRSHNEPSTPNRKRGHESMEDDVWTEHTSSSGRVYYYNKRLDKSQWERPIGFPLKKAKIDITPDNSSSSGRKTASTPAVSSSSSTKHSSHSHSHHSSHHHKDHGRSSSHRSHHTTGSHTHHSHDRKERYDRSHHSSSRRGSPSRSHSRSSSPVGGGSKSDRGKYSSRGHTHSSSSRGSGYERSKERERESGSRHSKSEHTTPTSRVHTTTSPCTPVITSSGNLSQAGLVSPSGSTPHSSTPYTSLTNTTPINSTSIAILSTPQGSYVQPLDQPVPGAQHKLPYTPQQQLQQASNGIYVQDAGMGGVGGVAMGYMGIGGGSLPSPQTVSLAGMDATGLHPLQKALLIQNQVQNYTVVEPNLAMAPAIPHHMTQQQSHPNSPLLQSPISIPQHGTGTPIVYGTQTAQPLTPVQPRVFAIPGATPHGTFDSALNVPGGFVTVNSPTLRTPMSSLGYQRADSGQFPDPSKLETVGASHMSMELFNRGLAEPWNQYHNQVQQQIESCQLESLQRRTTETIFLSSKLARSRLRLETSQVSTTSRDNRLSGLRSVIEDISNR